MGHRKKYLSLLVVLVFLVSQHVSAVPLTELFPFGLKFGDDSLPPGDDASATVTLQHQFPFYGQSRQYITVHTDGRLDLRVDQYSHSSTAKIFTYSANVDTTNIGEVFYRETKDPFLLKKAAALMLSLLPELSDATPTSLFITTWFYVGYYDGHSDKTNTFQCVLATNGTISFATFLYVDGHMQWTASDCDNGGALEVGFLDGSNSGSYLFPPDDLTDIDTGSNAGYPGKWFFRVDGENLITPDAGAVKTAMEIEERDRRDISGEGPTIDLQDGEISIGFEVAALSVFENQSFVEVCVVIDATQLSEVATIEFQLVTNDGNATAPDDYTAFDETIMIAASTQHQVCRNIMILDDKIFENDETFHIILCLPPGFMDSRLRFTITQLYITITDTTVFVEGCDFISFIELNDPTTVSPFELMQDGTSSQVEIEVRFPFGIQPGTVQEQAFFRIAENGAITFDLGSWRFFQPVLFPSIIFTIRNRYVLAPFWADHDIQLGGSVQYQVFQCGVSDLVDQQLEFVSIFIRKQFTDAGNFLGVWMLVVNWNELPQFAGDSMTTNTYQAIAITDGINSYAIYTYNCDLMGWGGGANIGFNAFGQTFRNEPASGRSTVHTDIACQNVFGDRGVRYANVLNHVGSTVNPAQRDRVRCLELRKNDIQMFPTLFPIHSCPCTFRQAIRDWRFFAFAIEIQTAPFFSIIFCFRRRFPLVQGGNLKCCYRLSGFAFVLKTGTWASAVERFDPRLFPSQNAIYDDEFRRVCCSSAGLCNTFHTRRPRDCCFFYFPPFRGFSGGDPHITTLDEKQYTFNGLGEYTLLTRDDQSIVIQGRTELTPGTGDTGATQFSAFAFGQPGSSVVEIQIPMEAGADFIVQYNMVDISINVTNINDTFSDTNISVIRTAENAVLSVFPNGVSVSVSVSGDIPNIVVSLPQDFRGQTRGLMGNFNGNDTDDLIFFNGTMLSSDASEREIFDFGQSWQITQAESLFNYSPGTSARDFSNPSHLPSFTDDVVSAADPAIIEACGGSNNTRCIFDSVQTNSTSVGMATQDFDANTMMDQMITINNPPMLQGEDIFTVNTGMEAVYRFNATDDDDFSVSTMDGVPDNGNLVQNGSDLSFTFTIQFGMQNLADFSLGFSAMDSEGATSSLQPQLQICACVNGNCTIEGVADTGADTIVLNCECPEAYTGRFCDEDVDGCAEMPCFEGVDCMDVPAPGVGAECGPCPEGYMEDQEKCIDINECMQSPSVCEQSCTNTIGSFACGCNPGFELQSDGISCNDTDECSEPIPPCDQTCVNTIGSFMCECMEGFELQPDNRTCNGTPCGPTNPCSDRCAEVNGTETCLCSSGRMLQNDGFTCVDINECMLSPPVCEQSCTDTAGSFVCGCNPGFVLNQDDESSCDDINECLTTVCPIALQICMNTIGSFICECPPGTALVDGACQVANIMFLETAITVEESAGFITVCINISGGLPDTAIVRLSTVANTATAGSDYTPVDNQALVFESSPNQVCVNICVINDMLVEETEQFSLTLTTAAVGTNLVISESRATVFVIDSSVVNIGFVVPTYTVDECASCPVTVAIGLSGSSLARNVTFTISTQDDTALGDEDYVPVMSMSLEFGPMSSSEIEIEIFISSDNITEDAEQFIAQLESSDSAVTLSTSSANITIIDISAVSVEFDPRSYAVNESSGSVSVCVRVNGQLARNVVVRVQTGDISATAPYDYTPIDQTLVFTPQMDRRYVDIEVADDIFREPNEFFGVILSSSDPVVNVLTTLAVVEIMDTSVPYFVVFQQPSYTVSESMSSITVGVDVSGIPPATEVTICLFTMEDSAEADEDYATTMEYVLLTDDGQAVIDIPILNDEYLENMLERFEVRVTATANVSGVTAEIPQESVYIFIIDADDGVSASLAATSFVISETEASRNLAVYVCVDLVGNRQVEVTLELTAESGSAEEDEDFPETSNTLVFPPGSGSQQECAAFPIIDDNITEGTESFTISLSSQLPCINITVDEASVEILDDDTVEIGFAQASFTIFENYSAVTVLIDATGEASRNLTISVRTEDGTATAGEDYAAISPPLMIELTPESLEEPIEVEITILNDDDLEQMIETFTVFLETSDPAVSLTASNATVLIVEDDGPLVMFTQQVYNGTEGDNATVCLTLNGEAVFDITVTLASMNDDAEAGMDYTMINENLTFVAGETVVCQDIELLLDNELENTESFTVILSVNDPPDVMIPFPTATVEILDANVADISTEFATYTVNERDEDVRVCVSAPSNLMLSRSVMVTFTTEDDTAQASMDYTAVSLELLFSGPTLQCTDIVIANDGVEELTEVFRVVLSSDDPVFAPSIGTAVVTIIDRDNDCDPSACDANAECRLISAGTVECVCNQGYTGDGFSCSLILPEISFVNNTPTVNSDTLTLTVQFLENEGVQSSLCQLGSRTESDCTGGTFIEPSLPPNKVTPFILRITSTAFDGSTTTQLTRAVNIGGRQTCSITIWNDGQVGATYTSQNTFMVEWEGAGPVESFNCILRQDATIISSMSCSSPFQSGERDPGNYFVEIQPMGSTCRVQRSTTVGPVILPNPDCNACDDNAECRILSAGGVVCTCNQGYTGDGFSCSLILPEISFINNTPTVNNATLTLTVQFSENEGVQSSVCQLGARPEEDCTGGTFTDPNFPRNKVTPFTLRITSAAFDGSTTTQLTRAVNIGGRQTCSITIWNDGQVGATYTSQNTFMVEWEGAGPVESFNCILRQDATIISSMSCYSPFESSALDPGNYYVEIQPMGSTCRVQRSTTVGPVVIPSGSP